jgi:RND family efflux transporter MFP subunit
MIPADVAERSGIRTEEVSPRVIETTVPLRGKIVPSEHRIAHVIPRFPGIVREGRKHIGDKVEKGEVLAIVESNQSLQPFEVRSQISGTVINGHLIVGEYVPENQWVYVVADLSEVWADFHLPLNEREGVKIGQSVAVSAALHSRSITGSVNYIAPYADERTQSQLVRVVIPNPDGLLVPGMFVTGDLVLSNDSVKAAVRKSALQTFRGWKVVFINIGEVYEIRPLTLGRADDEWIEVVSGIEPGERYVTDNSYTIKADILKSGASHDH